MCYDDNFIAVGTPVISRSEPNMLIAFINIANTLQKPQTKVLN